MHPMRNKQAQFGQHQRRTLNRL